MAKCYSPPTEIKVPVYDYKNKDYSEEDKRYDIAHEAFISELSKFCKEESNCPDAGEIIRFGVGDGIAQYMVFDYRTVIYVPYLDNYRVDECTIRGIRKADIIRKIKANKPLAEIFGRKIDCKKPI
jgi:hypothetical protein